MNKGDSENYKPPVDLFPPEDEEEIKKKEQEKRDKIIKLLERKRRAGFCNG